jgi:outer membrane immunogenic protein
MKSRGRKTRASWFTRGFKLTRFAIVCAAVLCSTGLAGTGSAADLSARPYLKAPPPAAVYNWTGLYVGANGGYGSGHVSSFDTVVGTSTSHDPSGGLAGGQIGYNWQIATWVFGVEADGDWADICGSAPCPNHTFNCASDTRSLASFRGRIGWAAGPALLYATGGLGYASTRYSTLTAAGGLPSSGTTGFYTSDRWGYALGAGIEYGFTPNWSAKLEYMHYGFDTATAPAATLGPNPVGTTIRVETVKIGINYRWAEPVSRAF